MFYTHVKAIIEALLFVAGEPLTAKKIAEIVEIDEENVVLLISQMRQEFDTAKRGVQIMEVAGGYQLCTRPEMASYLERMQKAQPATLSQAALETLAIIAFKQPVTRAEIEQIRGVKVESALNTLLERRLIREVGRKDTIGRPILYGTTKEFLRYFGLKDLDELPEISKIIVNHDSA